MNAYVKPQVVEELSIERKIVLAQARNKNQGCYACPSAGAQPNQFS
jgi:hypothetical protein